MANLTVMELTEFQVEWDKLVSWFNARSIKQEQTLRAYSRIKTYPLSSVEYSVGQIIESRRPTPGNFPTIIELINGCCEWLDQHPEERFARTVYDPDDDPAYPIGKMWDGYYVLEREGFESFSAFAMKNRMPRKDFDRVMAKHRYIQANIDGAEKVSALTGEVGEDMTF